MISPRNDVTLVKEINTDMVKAALKSLGKATKAQISDATGISVATCGKILNELCATNEVLETSQEQADYGRPAKSYMYNALFSVVGCIYVHTDNNQILVSSMVANLLGDTLEESIEETTTVNYPAVRDRVRSLCRRFRNLSVVSIGIPGYMTDGVVNQSNFHDLNGIDLGEMLRADFPEIKVMVENDTNAAAYGFYMATCGGRDATVAFLFSPDKMMSGTGESIPDVHARGRLAPVFNLGAGFVSGGRIQRGHSGFAGEVMNLPVNRTEYNAKRTEKSYVTLLSDVVVSIISIINPEYLALSGGFITDAIVRAVRERCENLIPPCHMPKIVLRKNIHNDYIKGLVAIALETLTCHVRLVYKY